MDLFRINIHVTLLSGTQAMQVEYYLKNNEAECLVKWNNIFRAFVFTSLYSIQTDGIACKFYCAVLLYLHMIHFYYLEWSYSLWTDFFSSSLPPFYYDSLNLKSFKLIPSPDHDIRGKNVPKLNVSLLSRAKNMSYGSELCCARIYYLL